MEKKEDQREWVANLQSSSKLVDQLAGSFFILESDGENQLSGSLFESVRTLIRHL